MDASRPTIVGLAYLTQAHPGDYGMLTAGYVLAALPLLPLFLLAMRQFIEGLTAGRLSCNSLRQAVNLALLQQSSLCW